VLRPIEGEGVVLRPTTADDLEVARRLFADPGFYEYWDGYPKPDDEIKEKYLGRRSPSVECFFVEVDGEVVGFTQYNVAEDHLGGGMDLVLLPAVRGRGIGARVVRTMVNFVRTELGWTRFSVDPEVANERGVNFWKKAGFVPVRIVDDGARPPLWHMEWPINT
jgi:aminoglycoside 6'-N-acetyltransferase